VPSSNWSGHGGAKSSTWRFSAVDGNLSWKSVTAAMKPLAREKMKSTVYTQFRFKPAGKALWPEP